MISQTPLEWYNANSLRAFPLEEGSVCPSSWFLDARVLLDQHTDVQISRLTKTQTGYALTTSVGTFTSSLQDGVLVFRDSVENVIVVSLEQVSTLLSVNQFISLSVKLDVQCTTYIPKRLRGIGQLVFGKNAGTTTPQPGTSGRVVFTSDLIRTGDIVIVDGYQVECSSKNNTIYLQAGKGLGLPISCSQTFSPVESDCSRLVSYINGQVPDEDGRLILRGGSGVQVSTAPSIQQTVTEGGLDRAPHTLLVELTSAGSQACQPVYSSFVL